MAIVVKDWNSTDTQYDVLKKILRALLAPLTGDATVHTSTVPAQAAGAPSWNNIIVAGGDLDTLVAGEHFYIQNLGTEPLFVRRATGASATEFHYVLQGGGAQDDGTGGSLLIEDHIGVVSATGTTPRFIAWKVAVA